ncbi:MAG: hypothetical protein PVH91_11090, partial [Pseudomonadales bacterium]
MAFWLMAFALLLPLVASANPAPTEITETLAEPGTPAEALPHPPALDAAVGFWKRVYSEVGNDGGLIHDDRYLDVVYTVLHFPEGT